MGGSKLFFGLIVVVLLMIACVLGGDTVEQGLQKDAKMMDDVQPYLQGCDFGTVRHFKGLTNHDWSEIWGCEMEGKVKTATLICFTECSKTLVLIYHPNWDKLDLAVKNGEYKEIK